MDLQARLEALEKRVGHLEDQEKIRECLAEYGYNADLGRSDKYVEGWTRDGVYDLDSMYLDGEADLREMISSPDGMHKSQIENRSQHNVLNLFIRIEGDSAWAEGYSLVFVRKDDNIKAALAGYNHWDFSRAGSRWLMKRRVRREIGGPQWGGEVIKQYLEA